MGSNTLLHYSPEASYPLIDGQSITTCCGIFYDDGGADTNYAANQNSTMTFCPSTANDYLVFNLPINII
jgi:hypothetical protein